MGRAVGAIPAGPEQGLPDRIAGIVGGGAQGAALHPLVGTIQQTDLPGQEAVEIGQPPVPMQQQGSGDARVDR